MATLPQYAINLHESIRWLWDWLWDRADWLGWLSLLSLLTLLSSAIILPWLVARLPEDYFLDHPSPPPSTVQPTLWRWLGWLARNMIGLVFFLAGLAMLVLPGQGVLTLLVSLIWLDFPYKRSWEQTLFRFPAIHGPANWIRFQSGKPPLRIPPNSTSQPLDDQVPPEEKEHV